MSKKEIMSSGGRISREQLLQGGDRQEEVQIPELGGTVLIQALSLAQTQRIRRTTREPDTDELDLAVYTVIEGLVDPRLDPGDMEALRQRNAGIVTRLAERIIDLSGLNSGDAMSAEKN